jgi:hypothetical protein
VIRAGVLTAARLVLLGGATALAFFAGGYFPSAQAWAGLAAWALVVVAAAAERRSLPRDRAAWLALCGLGLLGGWTLLSTVWAPIAGNAYHEGQLAMLYAGVLLAATLLLRSRAARRWVEPALAAGTLVVIGYGISERLLPGLLHFARSASAKGRLEQPLTYWNAMGEVAALGFVLCAGIAGDRTRPVALRAGAAAAAAPLGMGLYISFSRGALFACIAGLVALVVLAPRREQLWAVLCVVAAGALAAIAAAPFHGVTGLADKLSTRETQGAIVLVLLVVIGLLAAAAQLRLSRPAVAGELRLSPHSPLIATGVIIAGLALAIVVGAHENSGGVAKLSGGANRLVSLQSNRYDYWSVALRAFGSQPLHGVGAGGWSVYWLQWRTIDDFAQDAHSLELQTLAELGLVGFALLVAFLAGVALASRRALRSPLAPAAAIGALVTYLAHSPLDWDWQMPAVTIVALVLAGMVLSSGELSARSRTGAPGEALAATAPRRSAAPRG